MITPEKTIVNRRDAEVDNGFREVSISTVTLAKRHFLYGIELYHDYHMTID